MTKTAQKMTCLSNEKKYQWLTKRQENHFYVLVAATSQVVNNTKYLNAISLLGFGRLPKSPFFLS
jgi:hypothetical protein